MFIVFEGGEGAGKTTMIEKVGDYIENEKEKTVLNTREPGGNGSKVAEDIRNILKDPKNKNMTGEAELGLFLASRTQHLQEIIKPFIDKDSVVICDRFFGSTLAYQHFARGLFSYDFIKELNDTFTGGIEPDLTIYLDLDPEVAFERIGNTSDCRIDSENIEFHKKVRNGFLEIANKENNWYIIDANDDIDNIFEKIKEILDTNL